MGKNILSNGRHRYLHSTAFLLSYNYIDVAFRFTALVVFFVFFRFCPYAFRITRGITLEATRVDDFAAAATDYYLGVRNLFLSSYER